MKFRRFRASDTEALREIHQRAGYGFDFPEVGEMLSGWVVEDGGRVRGYAGAELEAQIYGLFDSEWQASPHQKIKAIARLHVPIARALARKGCKTANLWADPKFPAFGRHLLRMGWSKSLWPHYFRNVKRFIEGLNVKRVS